MEFLGIGPMELVLILVVAIIVLGPKDMVKAGRTIGKFLHTLLTSDAWKAVRQTTKELENLPTRLVREAGLEDEVQKLQEDAKKLNSLGKALAAEATKTIAPPEMPDSSTVSTQTVSESQPGDPGEPSINTIGDPVAPNPPSQPPSSEPGK
jgi:sec-independent protein translocase protein TatB